MGWNPDLIHKQLFKDGIGKNQDRFDTWCSFHENDSAYEQYRLDGAFLHSFIKPVLQIHKDTAVD